VAQSRSATATAICATIVGTAWDVADGSAASLASAPWSSEGPGCFFAPAHHRRRRFQILACHSVRITACRPHHEWSLRSSNAVKLR
jgi:hypothetical protein